MLGMPERQTQAFLLAFNCPACLLALVRQQVAFAQANAARGYFNQFVIVDVSQGLLKRQDLRRGHLERIVLA